MKLQLVVLLCTHLYLSNTRNDVIDWKHVLLTDWGSIFTWKLIIFFFIAICGRAKASPQSNLDVGGQRHFLKRTWLTWSKMWEHFWHSFVLPTGMNGMWRNDGAKALVLSSRSCHVTFGVYLYQQRKLANNSRTSIIVQLSGRFEVLTGKSLAWSDTLTGHFC